MYGASKAAYSFPEPIGVFSGPPHSSHTHLLTVDDGKSEQPRTAGNPVLPPTCNATIRVGLHCEWELHRCEDHRILSALSPPLACGHTEGSFHQYSRSGVCVQLLRVQYVPPFPPGAQ